MFSLLSTLSACIVVLHTLGVKPGGASFGLIKNPTTRKQKLCNCWGTQQTKWSPAPIRLTLTLPGCVRGDRLPRRTCGTPRETATQLCQPRSALGLACRLDAKYIPFVCMRRLDYTGDRDVRHIREQGVKQGSEDLKSTQHRQHKKPGCPQAPKYTPTELARKREQKRLIFCQSHPPTGKQ